MDYKSVIEEQIRELQETQVDLAKNVNSYDAVSLQCTIADTIAKLLEQARRY
jgi:hypothetical protein